MDQSRDDILEEVAQWVERFDLLSYAGIISRKKRDREDAALRVKVTEDLRKKIAAEVRWMKTRRDRDAKQIVQDLSELGDFNHVLHLRDGWKMASLGYVRIKVIIDATSNQVGPPTEYKITLTDKGRELIADHASDCATHNMPAMPAGECDCKG
jgi:DNA-binding MarR family transcriptional regulator